jgi:hypothetical protein
MKQWSPQELSAVFNLLITVHPKNQYFFFIQSHGNLFNMFPTKDTKNLSTKSHTLTNKV